MPSQRVGTRAAPPNDNFAAATPLSAPATVAGTNAEATTETGEVSACATSGASVWFRLVPVASGNLTATTAGSDFDTTLTLYQGTALATLTTLACNDDYFGDLTSRVDGTVVAGQTYHLRLAGYAGDTGNYTLQVAVFPPPANDTFSAATVVGALPAQFALSTLGATTEAGEPSFPTCASGSLNGSFGRTVWYRYTPAANAVLQVSTAGSDFDTMIAVYTGGGFGSLAAIGCNDQVDSTNQSRVSIAAVAGTTYRIQIGGYYGSAGNLVASFAVSPPPANDDFSAAVAVGALPARYTLSTGGASVEVGEPLSPTCASGSVDGAAGATVWYRYTPSVNTTVNISTIGSDFDTIIAVYTGSVLGGLTAIACNDQIDNTNQSRVSVAMLADTTYRVQIGGYLGQIGNLVAFFGIPPVNDNFAAALDVGSLPAQYTLSTSAAVTEVGEPLFPACDAGSLDGPFGATVWYRYTAAANTTLQISTAGSSFDTMIAVYTGSTFGSLRAIACNDQFEGTSLSRVSIATVAGTTYRVQIGGYYGSSGNLVASFATPPPNDNFANAQVLTVPGTANGSNLGATTEAGEPAATCATSGASVWYRFTPATSGAVTVSTAGSSLDTVIALYTGSVLSSLTQIACNDDFLGTQSQISANVTAGVTYQLKLAGWQGLTGSYTLSVSSVGGTLTPTATPTPVPTGCPTSAAAGTSRSSGYGLLAQDRPSYPTGYSRVARVTPVGTLGPEPPGRPSPSTPTTPSPAIVPAGLSGVLNGGFETGNCTGWQNQTTGLGNWFVYSGATSPINSYPIGAPPEGTFAATTDTTGPGSHILYQDVALATGSPYTLSFTLYYQNLADAFATPDSLDHTVSPNQQYRVDILRAAAAPDSMSPSDILATVFRTQVGDPLSRAPGPLVFDLSPFAGSTVRLRFAQVDNQAWLYASVDNVQITAGTQPTVTPTATRTPTASATARPTLPPGAVSGRALKLESGSAPSQSGAVRARAGERLLSWTPGSQTSSLLLRWSPEHGFAFRPELSLSPIPPGVGSYADSDPLTDSVYCYSLLAFLGDRSNPDIRGLSDLLCMYPGTGGGINVPGAFSVGLNDSDNVELRWIPPAGQTGYELTATRFDGTGPRTLSNGVGPDTFTENTNGLATCYQLRAIVGGQLQGGTDVLCAVPRVSSFGAAGGSGQAALSRLGASLAAAQR